MNEGPVSPVAADDREGPPLDHLDDRASFADCGARAIEHPVSQGDRLEELRAGNLVFEGSKCRESLCKALGRLWVERIFFRLYRTTLFRVRPAAVALSDESLRADGARGREQRFGDFGAEPVGQRELLIEFPEVASAGERRELVDDHLGLGAPNRRCESRLVQRIDDDRGHAAVLELLGLCDRKPECYDFVFILDQQWQQEFSDCPSATGNKDSHSVFVGLDGMRRGSPIDELRRPSANLTVNRYPRSRSNGLYNLSPTFGPAFTPILPRPRPPGS